MPRASELFSDEGDYYRAIGQWSRSIGELFADWVDIPKGLNILDVGCGYGAFTEILLERCGPSNLVGVDDSETQFEYARECIDEQSVQFVVGNAMALPFSDNCFDAALMTQVIPFLTDPAKAVLEMARVVRPGGWIATYTWDVPGYGLPGDLLARSGRSLGMTLKLRSNSNLSRREVLQYLCEQAGLQSIEHEVFNTGAIFADFDDFWDFSTLSTPTGELLKSFGADSREKLRARTREIVETAADASIKSTAADGSFYYYILANAVKGRVPA